MIGYKKVYAECKNQYGTTRKYFILKLKITGAVVRHACYDKLRTSEVVVLEAYHLNHARLTKSQQRRYVLRSIHDPSFVYRVGDTVSPRHQFDSNINEDCGSGIHFYLTKKEAVYH